MRYQGVLPLIVLAQLAAGPITGSCAWARSVKATLTPTAAAPGGLGRAVVSARNSRGKFTVLARHLPSLATFQVVVAGFPIGTLVTGPGGSGRARFSTSPNGNDQHLGIDPRGQHVTVHEMDDGEDALEGDVPDDSEAGEQRCCLSHDDESECEDRTEGECLAEGGTPGSGSCLPDPCGGATPGELKACCEPDDHESDGVSDDPDGEHDGAECELRTAAQCAEHHGVVMDGGSCDANACVPAGGDAMRCCLPDEHDGPTLRHDEGEGGESELECEHLTAQHCLDAGGKVMEAGSCEGNPCATMGDGITDAGGDDS